MESTRLPGWDYSYPGFYFLTVVTYNRSCLFGEIKNDTMLLNEYGKIAKTEWLKSFEIRRELIQDQFTVMPNHFHGIVQIVNAAFPVETRGRASLESEQSVNNGIAYCAPRSVSSFVGGLKSVITKSINHLRNTPGARCLQYRFHDHVIRDENELYRIRKYIADNPKNWGKDKFNSDPKHNGVREDGNEYEQEIWMV